MVAPRQPFLSVDDVPLATDTTVYEHGWQSWSPTGCYPASLPVSPRPQRERWQTMSFRPGSPAADEGFQGEGLLAVIGSDGSTRAWFAPDPAIRVPSIRARRAGRWLRVTADGPVEEVEGPDLEATLAEVARRLGDRLGAPAPRQMGPGWCSWYGYWAEITDVVLDDNLAAMDRLDLDVRMVQIDDGYQRGIGDWLDGSGRIASLPDAAARIRSTGREAGIWTAPLLVGADSRVARAHPDWLVGDAVAADEHWGQRMHVLDVTHPDAAAHLAEVFHTLRSWGFSFHKADFLYGGAIDGRRHGDAGPIDAYREGLRLIREGIGPDATLLGCGAPILPSIGLVDAMRVSPDIDREREPPDGDLSQPSSRAALAAGRARAWTHGRWWVADPDCIVAGGEMADRPAWNDHLEAFGGLALSSDRLPEIDDEAADLTRRLLRPSKPTPARWLPGAGPDGGRLVRDTDDALTTEVRA